MFTDFVINGQGHGVVGEVLAGTRFDPGLLRPYIDSQGRRCVTVNSGRRDNKGKPVFEKRLVAEMLNAGVSSPVFNATSLRKEEWIEMDRLVVRAARPRLKAWSDLSSRNSFGGFNGMAKTVLEHETMTDVGEAIVDMDGMTEGRNDAPQFQMEGLPLPITHVDFWFSARKLAESRNSGTPLDMTLAENAARRVAEKIEKTLIGVETGITGPASPLSSGYGRTPSVYGYLNFSQRLTKTNLTTPTASNQATVLADILAMRDQLTANRFYGPFMLYHSDDWDAYMDGDYILSGGNVATQTLRNRIRAIDGIEDVRRLDYLFSAAQQQNPYYTSSTVGTTGQAIYRGPAGSGATTARPFTLIMVQMTSDVVRAVNGMDITTVQWESVGGMRLNFKVMCIQVPQIRADAYGNCGLLVATTS